MTSQSDIIPFIRERKVVTYKEIMAHFKMDQPAAYRKVRQLNKFGIVVIEVDGQKHFISLVNPVVEEHNNPRQQDKEDWER